MRWTAALAALALAGCESRAASCPGQVQGTLGFVATGDGPGSTCSFFVASPQSTSFPAAVSWLDSATAALCVERPLSAPKQGPRSGDLFAVSSSGTAAAGAVGTCACSLELSEVLSGTLQRDLAGRVTGFASDPGPGGEPPGLTVTVTRADPQDPLCDQSPDCPGAGGCILHYDVRSP